MSNPTLFAIDYSGSTGGKAFYHETCQRLVAECPDSTTLLLWDSEVKETTRAELAEINRQRKGNGGTWPHRVAEYIAQKKFHGDLVFLSDGQVYSTDIAVCTSFLGLDWKFSSVRIVLVNTGGVVNMSVSCPFTRVSPHTVTVYDTAGRIAETTTVTDDALALLTKLDDVTTVTEWERIAPLIEPAIIARTMGLATGDPTLRDALLRLKTRLVRSAADTCGQSPSVTAFVTALDSGVTDAAIRSAATLAREYYEGDDLSWSGVINRLVSMCDGALKGAFDLSGINAAIKSDRARRATSATPFAATDAEAGEPIVGSADAAAGAASGGGATDSFVCPITCDTTTDIALLIADAEEPLLAGLDKAVVTDLTKCPLFLFRYPEVLERFRARIDHPISLEGLKGIWAASGATAAGAGSAPLSPLTRKPLLGALCLGPHTDHGAATNWTLARVTAGGKCLGNPDLWFAAIWLLVKRGSLPFLTPILPHIETHLLWRLRTHKAPLALLGVPEFPTTRVPLGAALWYAIGSSAASASASASGAAAARETLRAHLPNVEEIREILSLIGYALPSGFAAHLARLRTVLGLLAWCKVDNTAMRLAVKALYQAAILLDGRVIALIDGPATPAQITTVRKLFPTCSDSLHVEELIRLADLVAPGKSAGDVDLPFNWSSAGAGATATPVISWSTYGLAPLPATELQICPATCRPYFYPSAATKETWMDSAWKRYNMRPEQFLPVNAEFGEYVVKHTAYPTKEELLTHLWKRIVAQNNPERTTLPAQVEQFVENVLDENAAVMASLTPAEFAARFEASRKREDRIRLERAA